MPNGSKNRYRQRDGTIIFRDNLDFRPNMTPREIFREGSFGGTYWRPIYSSITGKNYKNQHKKFPSLWWKGIGDEYLVSEKAMLN